MGPEFTSAIVAAVGGVIAAASAYYSRQRALPEIKKREACQSLVRLRDALKAVAYTGEDIGRRMTTRTFERGNDAELHKFIRLLEEQNENLRNAETGFSSLATIFEIQAPELNPLIIHIRGKLDRIEIIYSVASSVDLRQRLRRALEPWEESEVLREPRELTPVVHRGSRDMRIEPHGQRRELDEHYQEIVDCIPSLTEFIKAQCDAKYLK